MRYIIGCGRFAAIGVLILIILAAIFICFPLLSRDRRGRWVRRIAGWIPGALGMTFAVKGYVPDEPAFTSGVNAGGCGYMVCSNHISFVDIFVLDAVLPCRFVAKKEIASWPVFGAIAKGVDTLFIDRSRKRAVLEIAELMAQSIAEGRNVLFFPEGTTGQGEKLLPFYANLFQAAAQSQARILPVTIRYTCGSSVSTIPSYAGKISLFTVLKRIVFTPGLGVEVTVLDPVESKGKDRQQLCRELSALMSASLGVPDATAEKETARQQRLRAASQSLQN